MAQAGAPVVFAPGTVPGSFLPEPDDVEFDEGTMSLEPVPCALTADVDGELPLIPEQFHVPEFPGELQGVRERGRSLLRCWPENDEQFHRSEFKGKLNGAGEQGESSLRCWSEVTEQFQDFELKGQLHGRRRRGERTISSSRCSSSAQVRRSSACSTRSLCVVEAG